jgi:SAM-dependent methyltransferase
MGIRARLRPRIQEWVMSSMNDLRSETVSHASGEVLEVGFGTALNLPYYGTGVRIVTGLDPMPTEGIPSVESRISAANFPVEREVLRADGGLPYDTGRFDTVLTTWTLCEIPDPVTALAEMRRVLKAGGQYVFVEHGRSESAATARWQDRLNPLWKRIAGGCNMNRRIDELVERGGFELRSLDRFRADGPAVLASLYRGIATRG